MQEKRIQHVCEYPCHFSIINEETNTLHKQVSAPEDSEQRQDGETATQGSQTTGERFDSYQMEVYAHAVEGFHSNKTITLTGQRGKQSFSILITGAVHIVSWMKLLLPS